MLNDRIYLDYNATSPLAKRVKTFLASGIFNDANPSAQHFAGKQSRKLLNDSVKTIKSIFNKSEDYQVVFHSGATEAANMVLQGFVKVTVGGTVIVSETDHKCVLEQQAWLEHLGAKVKVLPVNTAGIVDLQRLEKWVQTEDVLVNITIVNNETGVVQPMDQILKLKEKYKFKLHVDAAQLVGKVESWQQLNNQVEAYSFSGHKFGALKGCGFTLIKDLELSAFIYGGGQQSGLRSGTENPIAAKTIAEALLELSESFNFKDVKKLKEDVISIADDVFSSNVKIISSDESCNTVSLLLKNMTADKSLPFFDMNGIDVSNGSACNSGDAKKSHVLIAMGEDDLADHAIRISLPLYNFDNRKIISKLKECFIKLSS